MMPLETPPEPVQEKPSPEPTPAQLVRLQSSVESMKLLFHVLLVSLLILNGGLLVFLVREVGVARRQANDLAQFVTSYEKNSVPAMRAFRDKLVEFTKSNPDFRPILAKYFNPTSSAAPAFAPGLLSTPTNAGGLELPDTPGK